MAWDPAAAVGALPGVLVAHTAIGPQAGAYTRSLLSST
jgi:hypothetical protein